MKPKVKTNKFRIAIVVFVLLFCLLYFMIYVAPKVSDAFVETYVCEYGTLDVDFTSDYLCVRNENLHTADAAGTVDRKASAGNLVRIGNKVVNVGGVDYRAQERGLVSYTYDGLEDNLTPDTIADLTPNALNPPVDEEGNSTYKLRKCVSETAAQGDPLFKIIDNHRWYLVTWVDQATAEKLSQYGRVTIELNDEEHTQLRFRVDSVETEDPPEDEAEAEAEAQTTDEAAADETEAADDADAEDKAEAGKKDEKVLRKAVFSCDRYYSNVDGLRYGTARIITTSVTGIILETSSIAEEDGVKGVYVKNKYNDYVFTPISIIAEVGDKTVVENRTFYDSENDKIISTVKNYDSIKKGDGSGDVDQN